MTALKKEDTPKDISCYSNSNRPNIAITYEEMQAMFDAYKNEPKKVSDNYIREQSNGRDTVSTTSSWYRLNDLKQYIAYLEKISMEKGIELTGIRIYPASYPKDFSNKEYAGTQTLIFAPTALIGGKNDVAFEPLYSEKGKPVPITKFLKQAKGNKSSEARSLLNSKSNALESSAANRGNIEPPY